MKLVERSEGLFYGPDQLKQAALWYAKNGMKVFPIRPRGKTPLTQHGFKDASGDSDQIEKWWNEYPDANIGIATGQMSGGLVVVDIDYDEDKGKNGYETLEDWCEENGCYINSLKVTTGRGGAHYYFTSSEPFGSKTDAMPSIDIRGEGGYVVAPPSVHANGNAYFWDVPDENEPIINVQEDSDIEFFLHEVFKSHNKQKSTAANVQEVEHFELPETVKEGSRNATLYRQACSMQSKGVDNQTILDSCIGLNQKRFSPPMPDDEVERIVRNALKWEKGSSQKNDKYDAYLTMKKPTVSLAPMPKNPIVLESLEDIQEEEPEWLIPGYIPRGQITVMGGEGGTGKTSVWTNIAASVSSGIPSILEQEIPEDFVKERKPGTVIYFSSEDSSKTVLKARLRKQKANFSKIKTLSLENKQFSSIKFNSQELEDIISSNKPELIVFDPLQSFIPEDIQMGSRNAMRSVLNPLIGLGEKYNCTFLIVMHCNKQSGVWGRKRLADSSDIWDIARSVLLLGETSEKGQRYISQEKCNYGRLSQTVLFHVGADGVSYDESTDKKDRDFVTESDYQQRQKPSRDNAKQYILDFMSGYVGKENAVEVNELDSAAESMNISKSTLGRAKTDLFNSGAIGRYSRGGPKDKKWFMYLKESKDK